MKYHNGFALVEYSIVLLFMLSLVLGVASMCAANTEYTTSKEIVQDNDITCVMYNTWCYGMIRGKVTECHENSTD